MKTIRVPYDDPPRSKSRNVNAYTRALAQSVALARAARAADTAAKLARLKLDGRMMTEANRLLLAGGAA